MALAALAALLVWGRNRIHFDFSVFGAQLAHPTGSRYPQAPAAFIWRIAFRSVRWAQLIKHSKVVAPFSLLGTQVMGFHSSGSHQPRRRSGTSLSCGQKRPALLSVPRLRFLHCRATVQCGLDGSPSSPSRCFGCPLPDIMRATSHSKMVSLLGSPFAFSCGVHSRATADSLASETFLGALFFVAVRLAGNTVAAIAERAFGLFSKQLGSQEARRFVLSTPVSTPCARFGEFSVTAGLSIGMWLLICRRLL